MGLIDSLLIEGDDSLLHQEIGAKARPDGKRQWRHQSAWQRVQLQRADAVHH